MQHIKEAFENACNAVVKDVVCDYKENEEKVKAVTTMWVDIACEDAKLLKDEEQEEEWHLHFATNVLVALVQAGLDIDVMQYAYEGQKALIAASKELYEAVRG